MAICEEVMREFLYIRYYFNLTSIQVYMFTGLQVYRFTGLRSNYYENPSKVNFAGLLGLHVIDDNLFQLPVIS